MNYYTEQEMEIIESQRYWTRGRLLARRIEAGLRVLVRRRIYQMGRGDLVQLAKKTDSLDDLLTLLRLATPSRKDDNQVPR